MSDRTYYEDDAVNAVSLAGQRESFSPRPGALRITDGFKPVMIDGTVGPLLLGIDCGHLRHPEEVFFKGNSKVSYQLQSNTGIAVVVPSWKIMDVLNTPKLVEDRAKEDEVLKRKAEEEGHSFVEDSVRGSEPSTFTQQDSEQALQKASRGIAPSQFGE
jgi:hypothetical protein